MNTLFNASLPQTFGAVPLSLPGVNMSPLPVGKVVLGPTGGMPMTLPISGVPMQPIALGTMTVDEFLDLQRPPRRRRRQRSSQNVPNPFGQPAIAQNFQAVPQPNPAGLAQGSFPIVSQVTLPGVLVVPRPSFPMLPQAGLSLVPQPSFPMVPQQGLPQTAILPTGLVPTPPPYVSADRSATNPPSRSYGKSTKAAHFSPEEDDRLAAICEAYESRKITMREWQAIATKHDAGYTSYQCRIRWHNFLKPPLDRSPITPEERKELFRASILHNNNWSHISSLKCAGKTRSPYLIRQVCCAQRNKLREANLAVTTAEDVDKLPLSMFAEETTFEEEESSC